MTKAEINLKAILDEASLGKERSSEERINKTLEKNNLIRSKNYYNGMGGDSRSLFAQRKRSVYGHPTSTKNASLRDPNRFDNQETRLIWSGDSPRSSEHLSIGRAAEPYIKAQMKKK